MIDVRNEMEKPLYDYSTARGRALAKGCEIKVKKPEVPDWEISDGLKDREAWYLDGANQLKTMVECNSHYGVEADELEAVEFIIEQYKNLAEMMFKKRIERV